MGIFIRVVLQILLLLFFSVLVEFVGGVRGRKQEGTLNEKNNLVKTLAAASGDWTSSKEIHRNMHTLYYIFFL